MDESSAERSKDQSGVGREELSRLEAAINEGDFDWTLCFVGEDQSEKLAALIQTMQAGVSDSGDGKKIGSGFSYWGIGPTVAWVRACKDPLYVVMKKGIESFRGRWEQIQSSLEMQHYHYVSLGVGTGDKDFHILNHLGQKSRTLYYFPVDMSPEMLREGIRSATNGLSFKLKRHRILPVQIDFSIDANIDALHSLLDCLVADEPVLFSLLGNTLANFDDDVNLLRTLSRLIRPQDRLLLEVARTADLSEGAAREAAIEYENSSRFKKFVATALIQNTNLRLDLNSISCEASLEPDKAIVIKTVYQNKTDDTIKIVLTDGNDIDFPRNDTIRLFLSR